jgi:hypothetical protein
MFESKKPGAPKEKSNLCLAIENGSEDIDVTFAFIFKGCHNDIDLPQFSYQDPLTKWSSYVCSSDNPAVVTSVQEYWGKYSGECDRNMAQFQTFLEREPANFEVMKMDFKGGNVSMDYDSYKGCKQGCLLNMWSHGTRTRALLSQVLETPEGRSHMDRVTKEHCQQGPLMDQDCVVKMINDHQLHDHTKLPTSFKYPTLGISHMLLPPPNQVGYLNRDNQPMEGCLVRKTSDQAHLKCAKEGADAVCLNENTLQELIKMHATDQSVKGPTSSTLEDNGSTK